MIRILKIIKKPKLIIMYLMNKGFFRFMKDENYLKMEYRLTMGKKLNLKNPKTFNEKLQWLKLNNRKDIYTTMVDKYEAKKYMADLIGEKYIIPTLGIYKKFSEIEFENLPNEFVLKCNHDSGGLFIIDDKRIINKDKIEKSINKILKNNYFYDHREWPYKNVKPKIIIEPLLKNSNGSELIEYNLFCFNGEPKIIMTCHGDKRIKRYNDFYDMEFNKLNLKCSYDSSNFIDEKPKQLSEMIKISRKLSKDIPFLRVDFFLVNEEIKMGELTFFHWSGYGKFEPEEYDLKFGNWINIQNK